VRLWSLHPSSLDRQRLLGVWREGLLALHVLAGRTTGYQHHPQLERFRAMPQPVPAVGAYLVCIAAEASSRGYSFDLGRIAAVIPLRDLALVWIPVTCGQVDYERSHLAAKIGADFVPSRLHPTFHLVPGPIESWERFKRKVEPTDRKPSGGVP
jgi:hypothetical protein